ncbi:MAG TPA: FAD-binding oxidoreductase [Ilumatobacteraceae bacterium]|nr:FAD-binding oxidoreductase [Ilumatobacteraceae bacterium]
MELEATHILVEAMVAIVGDAHVLADDAMRAGYETDWTGRYTGRSSLVVRPASTDEVAAVLRHCNDHGVMVVPQGGNTGLVGGGVPRRAPGPTTIVLSLRRLDAITHVDTTTLQLTAGAGTTIAAWQSAARQVGLDTPIDFAARDSATVGGAIATNAGGSRVLRYGTMRQQVVGVEAVLANGSIVGTLPGLTKETVGLHWPSVLAGSEGTLAVVTAVRLRMVPRFEHVVTAMLSMATIEDAIDLVGHLRQRLGSLDSVEIIQPEALELVAEHLGATSPIDVVANATVLLIECADHSDPSDALATVLALAAGVVDSAVTVDPAKRRHLVQFRDRITDAIAAAASTRGVPTYKLDVAVPLSAVGELLDIAHRAAGDDGARLIPFGHLAEGNLHLNFLGTTQPETIADSILTAAARLGGTISAEHGIGIAKTQWLHLIRSRADLDAQAALRRALDPNRILNPGVLDPTAPAPQAPAPQVRALQLP